MYSQDTFVSQILAQITRKRIVTFVVVIIVLLIGWLLFNNSFVEITVANNSSGQITYSIANQNGKKQYSTTTDKTTFKKLVWRGSYEINVTQGSESYFAVVKTGGFLRTKTVSAMLQGEKSRQFVGDNPGSCMNFVANRLASYACNDLYSNVVLHMPATKSTPTFTKNTSITSAYGYVEGIVQNAQGSFVILQPPTYGEARPYHSLFKLTPNLGTIEQKALDGLDLAKTYRIEPYKDGFIAYTLASNNVYYFTLDGKLAQNITLESPHDQSLSLVSVTAKSSSIVATFAPNADAPADKNTKTELIVVSDGQSKHLTLKGAYSQAVVCGQSDLCALNSHGMDVYATGGKKAKFLYTVNAVVAMQTFGDTLLIVNKHGVMNFDVEKRDGFYEYSFGDYTFSGLQSLGDSSYLLSVAGPNQKKVALLINRNDNSNDNIDKKILELGGSLGVTGISIYKHNLFVTGNYGAASYNRKAGGFIYDPATVKKTKNDILNQIKNIGVGQDYHVTIL